jgi:hypothetical protein
LSGTARQRQVGWSLKSGGGRWSVIATAEREDLGALPVTMSRLLLFSVTDGEEHHQNAGDDDANQVVEAHELLATPECPNDVTIVEASAAP